MTLAMVFAAVYLLRSLPAERAGGFNPLSPCYALLGFFRGEACLNQHHTYANDLAACWEAGLAAFKRWRGRGSEAPTPATSLTGAQQQQQQRRRRQQQEMLFDLARARRRSSGASAATAAAAGVLSPGRVVPLELAPSSSSEEKMAWWKEPGEEGDVPAPLVARPAGGKECSPSRRLPSPAAVAAAASGAASAAAVPPSSSSSSSDRGVPRPESFPGGALSDDRETGGSGRDSERFGGMEGTASGVASGTAPTAADANNGNSWSLLRRNRPREGSGAAPPFGTGMGQGRATSMPSSTDARGGTRPEHGRLSHGSASIESSSSSSSSSSTSIGEDRQGRPGSVGPRNGRDDAASPATGAGSEGRVSGAGGGASGRARTARDVLRLLSEAMVAERSLWWLETWALPLAVVAFLVRQAFLLSFRFGPEAGAFAAAVVSAARVRHLAEMRRPAYPLPGVALGSLLTCLGAFGGNVLACLVTGTRSMVLTEFVVWPAAVAAWMLVGGRPGRAFSLRDLLSLPVVHHLLVFLSEAFRASLLCGAIDVARTVAPLVAPETAPCHARAMVSLFFVSVALVQTSRRGGGPHFNPYSLLHRVAYAVLGLDKPPPAGLPREFDARDIGGGRRVVEQAGGTGTADGSWNATAAAAGAWFAAGSGMSASRRSDDSHRLSSNVPSRRGRDRGSRGSLARGLGSGRPARGRSATVTTGRGCFARGVVGVWGPGRVGARGVGRTLVWTAAAVAVVVMSRLLALSTLAMDRTQSASHDHRQHEHQEQPWRQPSTAGMPFEGGGGGTPEKFPDSVVGGVDGAVGDAPAGAGAGAAEARKGGIRGWYERFRSGAKGSGDTSGRPPSPPVRAEVEAGAEDLADMDPAQLIEQVMAARKAAVEAADRADAAELAAAQLAIASEERTGTSPGAAAAGGIGVGIDRSGAGLSRRSEGREEENEREREGLGAESVDNSAAATATAKQSKALLGAAVEDYSSVVGEFSEVSKAWLEEMAVANPTEGTGDDVKVNRQAGEDVPFQEAKHPHAPIQALHRQPPHEPPPDRTPLDGDNLGKEATRISPSPSSTATYERPPGLAGSSALDDTSPDGTGEDASGSEAGALEPAVPAATAAAAGTAVLVSPGPWFQWLFGRPADVDEGPVTNLAPGGGDTALVRPGLPEDMVDVGDTLNAAALEQAVPTLLSLPENVLSAPESLTSGRAKDGPNGNNAPGDGGGGGGGGGGTSTGRSDEDAPAENVGGDAVSTSEAGDVGDPDAVAGDGGAGLHVSDPDGYENDVGGSDDSTSVEAVTALLEEGGMADLPGRGMVPPEDSSHMEEGSGGGYETSSGEGIGAEDVSTITDDDVFADVGSEGDVVLGDDPEFEAGGVLSLETGFAGGGDDAASVSPGVEANGENDMAMPTAGVGAFEDGRGGVEDSGSVDDAVTGAAEGGDDDSAWSIGDDEAWVVPTADDDAGDPAGHSSPHRSWLPWRRHRPADVDKDPLTNLEPTRDGDDLAGPVVQEDVVVMGDDDDASLEQTVSNPPSLPESGLLASEGFKSGDGEDNPDGTNAPDSGGSGDGDCGGGRISTTGLEEEVAAQLGEGGASDVADPPGRDGILPEEISYMKEGSGEGDETRKDQEVVVMTTTDEDDVADGSGGDFVLGDDPEGGPGGVTSMKAGLAEGGDGASGVSPPVGTNDDGPATSGSNDDTALSTAEVVDLADEHDATSDSGSNDDTIAVLATGGEASAVPTGDDEASGVQTADNDAGADEVENRPRRSWLPWRRHQPADVDKDPLANLAPAGDAAALAGLDLPEDMVDVGDDDDASLEQPVQSLPESVLLPPENIMSGRGEDRPDGTDGADAADDGGGSGGVDGDAVPTGEAGDVNDDTDGEGETQKDEGVGAADVTMTADDDGFADVGSGGDVIPGDDPEGGAGSVTSVGAGMTGGDDYASSVPPAVETNDDGSLSVGDESTSGVGALVDGHDATADAGSNDGAVGVSVTDGEASTISAGDDEASAALATDGDAGADEGETRPRRSWLPWRRHRPADVDEDPLTSLALAGDATALAGPDLPEGEVDVGDDDDAAESAPLRSPEKVVSASESITSGRGEDIPDGTGGADAPDDGGDSGGVDGDAVPTGEAGDISGGDAPDAIIRDVDTGLRASDGGGSVGIGMDGFGEGSSVEAEAIEAAATRLGEAGISDPPGHDGALCEESSHMTEGIDGGDEAEGDEGVEAGDMATSDEDGFADVGNEGDVVLGDDPEGRAGSVTSVGDGLAGAGDDASIVSPAVETNADGPSVSGGVSAAGVGTLVDGRDDAADSGSADAALAVAAEGGEALAVAAGDDEASGVSSTEGGAGVDEGETRPRRSWLPWRRHRPADVDEDPVTSFAPAGDDAALAGLDLPDDVIDMGDDLTAAALEQVVSTPSSLPESVLLASESAMNGEDVSAGEAGDVSDGHDRDAGDPVTGDLDLGPHANLEGGGRTNDVADPPGQDGTLSDESSHMEEGLADNAIISGAAGDGEASVLSISDDEVSDVSSTDGDAGIDEGETRPRRSWLPWHRFRPADVDEDPVTNLTPAGDNTALAGSHLPEDVVDVGDDLTAAAHEQVVLSLSESELLASESITDGGEDVCDGEASDVNDGDGPDAVTGDTGPGFPVIVEVNLEERRIGDMADLPGQDAVLPEENFHKGEGSAGGDGAWGGEDAQDGDLATITDEDFFADVSNEGDVVLSDDPEGGAGSVSSVGVGVTGGDEDASSASPAVDIDANDPATSGGVSTAEVDPLPGGDDAMDDSGLADDAAIAVVAEDGEALALSVGSDEAWGVPTTDGDAGAPAAQSIPRRSWHPWRRHRPADVDDDPATNLAPGGDDADLAGPDLPDDVVDVGDGDAAALEPAESTPLSLPEGALLASESATNDESSSDGTDAADGGGGVKAGASELDVDAAAEYVDGNAVPPPETGDVNDGDGPDAVAGDIGPGGGYDTGSDGFGESSSVEFAAAHLGEAGTIDMADPQEQVGALSEESHHMEEDYVGRDETESFRDDQDGGLAMIPDEEGDADVDSGSHAVLGDDPEGRTGGVANIGAGLAGGSNDVSSVSPALETEADDSSTSGSDGDSAVPIDAEDSPLVDGQDEAADSGLAGGAIIAGAAGDGEASALSIGDDEVSDVSSTDDDAGVDEDETRPRRSWLPWRRYRPAGVDEGPVTNLVQAGDDTAPTGADLPEDVVDVGDDLTAAAHEQVVLSSSESELLASESSTNGGDGVSTGEAGDVSDGDDPDAVTGDNGPSSHVSDGGGGVVNLEEGGTSDTADLPGQDDALADESVNIEEGSDGGDRTQSDEAVGAGDVATTIDEEFFDGSEGDAVVGDDPEGGASGVTSISAGLAGGGDDAFTVSQTVETNANDCATSGCDSDSAITTAEVCALRGGYYATGDSGSNAGGMCVLATDGDASAVATGDDEALGVSSKDSNADVDAGETRPRRSWFPWRRNRPADVDEDPVANLAPAGHGAGLAGSDLPDDVVDVGEDDDAALEQAVLSLPESELLAFESITDGGEDVSAGEAGEVSDGNEREAVAGDLAPTLHVDLEDGGTSDMADPPGQDGALSEESSHTEEDSDGRDEASGGEDAQDGDVVTTTDEDGFSDVGSGGDAVLGDDPEGGARGVASLGAGLVGGGDDASIVSPAVETNTDDPATSGGGGDLAVSTADMCHGLPGGCHATGDSGPNDGAVSAGDDETWSASSTNGDAGDDEGETRPRRSWLPWRRHRPANVDEDPLTSLAPAGNAAAFADPNLPEDVADVGDGDDASVEQAVSTSPSMSESVLLASESITNGGEDVSAGEAGDVSDGDDRKDVTGDNGPGSHVNPEEGEGTSDMADPRGQDGALCEEVFQMEEGSAGDDNTRSGRDAKAGDDTTTTDEADRAHAGDEGDAVLGDDPEGGAGGVTNMGDGLSGGDDDSSTSGGEGESAVSIDAKVSALVDGQDAAADSGAADGALGAEGGEPSAVSTSYHEALGDSSMDGDAGDDEGETRPRLSWLPWRRHRPVDVDEDTVTDLEPAVDDTTLAGPDLPEDMVDVGDDDDASLEQAVSTPSSMSENELLASESITDGGEDVSTGEAGDVRDGDDREAVIGDICRDPRGSDGGGDDVGGDLDDMGESTSVETFTANSEEGARDTINPPRPDGELPDESCHEEEGPGAGHGAGNGEHAKAGDVATTADESGFADVGSEGDVVLGDDPEGGAAGVASIGAGLTGGDDDASGVSADVATKTDDPAISGGYDDSAVSTAEVGDLPDGHDAIGEIESNGDPIGVSATGDESSAVSTGDDEASDVSPTEGDAGVDEGETRPRRSWFPWLRHRPADVDEDPVTNLEPAVDDTALAVPDLPDDVADVSDDLIAAAHEQVVLSLPESELLGSESITDGGEDISTGEASDVSDGDDRDAVTGDIGPDPHMNLEDGGTSDVAESRGKDVNLSEESSRIEVSGGGHDTQIDEAIEAGDVATTTDEDVFADDGSEGDVVLGDDPEGGAGGAMSMEAGLNGGDDDASSVSADVATKADDPAISGGDGDAAAVSNAEVGTLVGGRDDTADSGLADDADTAVVAEDGEASALSIGHDEASDVSPTDGDTGADDGETRPRRSWFPWRRHRPAGVDEDPVTNVAPAGDDAALVGSDFPEDVDVGDGLTAAALEQAVLSLSESALLASESITNGDEDVSIGEAGDARDGDAQDGVPDSRGRDGAGTIGDDLDDLGESAGVEAVTAPLEEGDASDMTDPPGQDRELPEESSHVEEGPGAGHVPGSGEDAKAGNMPAVTGDSVVADVGSEGDAVLGDDPEGFSDDAGVDDDDDGAPVVPVSGTHDASVVADGDAHAAAEDPPTALPPGETEAAARRRRRSPSKLAPDDVAHAAAVSQAAAAAAAPAAAAATAAATAGDDALELAATAVPVAAAGVGGAAAGPKALRRLFKFGRAPRGGEEGSHEEKSLRMTTSAADGDGAGMPSQAETPTEGVSPASAKDVEETVGLVSDADISTASAEEAVDLASNGLTTMTSSVLGEDEDPSVAAPGTGGADGDGTDRDEAGTPALESPPSLEVGPSAPAALALPSIEASSSRRREEDKAAAASLPTDPATDAAAEGLSPTAAAGSSAREVDEPAAHAASSLSSAEADDNAGDTAGPRTPKDVGSVLGVDDGGDDRAPVDAEDAASGSPLSQGAAATATADAVLEEDGKLRGGVRVGAGAEATASEDGNESDDSLAPPAASSGEDLDDAAVGNAAASSEDGLGGGGGGDWAALEAGTYAPEVADEGTSPGGGNSSSGEGGGSGGGGSEGGGGSRDGLEKGGEDGAAVVGAGALAAGPGEQEVPAVATDKDKDRVMEEEEEEERLRVLVGDRASEEMSREGESESISAESGAQGAENGEEESAADSKGWWARASDRRKENTQEKARKKASDRAVAERNRYVKRLELSKRRAFREDEKRDKDLHLLDEAGHQQAAGHTKDDAPGTRLETPSGVPARQGKSSDRVDRRKGDSRGDAGEEPEPQGTDNGPRKRRDSEEWMETSRPPPGVDKEPAAEQGQREAPEDEEVHKKNEKRTGAIVGVIAAAAYYGVWAAVAIALG
ncbi:unnamed protein product [Ectocarpus sp. CCAP 1310/34]|nr:unnamed protein product [Ectocarpus sp. CCAP 1310/34]